MLEIEKLFIQNKERFYELMGLIENARYDEDTTALEQEKSELKVWLNTNVLNVREELR